ncbi:SMP-30/gluconolactonase/LRE family protein [Streptomyces sp. NPDC088789]|uniref:SMP-30/gluconolactonase/LRE family protein n=1 Tax=Streptomyces sp. NPDC088789 TaxID=3365899 RepID=UPI00383075ED
MSPLRTHRRLVTLGLALAGLLTGLTGTTTVAAAPPAAPGHRSVQIEDTIALPGDQAYPEGIAVDPRNGDTYITAFKTGAVFRAAAGHHQAQLFLPPGTDGRTMAMGADVDKHGRLWVTDNDGVTVYDLATKARLARFVSPTPGQSVINDLDLTPNGNAYLTDSLRQLVYRITVPQLDDAVAHDPAPRTLTTAYDLNGLVAPHPAGSITLNGIESNATGSFLITVDMSSGDLFRLDTKTGNARKVTVNGDAPSLISADGLLLEKNKLWMAHFGTDRISRLALSADGLTATIEQQATDPTLLRPTTLVRRAGSLHVVRSQFGLTPVTLPFNIAKVTGI